MIKSICVLCCLLAGASIAGQVTLAWDPSPTTDIAEYRLHYGPASGVYAQSTNTTATTVTVTGLADGATYYFAVTAVGTNQLESDFSNEISHSTPPQPPENLRKDE